MKTPQGNNHSQSSWYVLRKKSMKPIFESGNHLREMKKVYSSDTGKYLIEIYPIVFRQDKRLFAFTHAKVIGPNSEIITEVFRNDEKFPFLFVENHIDGNDYLLCAEDTQAHTVVCLTTGERQDFVSERTKRGMEFSWRKFHLSPNGKSIAIEGTSKHKHDEIAEYREIRFFDFSSPYDLPYTEIGERIVRPYEEVIRWEQQGIVLSTYEEVRKSDNKPYLELNRKEVLAALKNDDLQTRRVIYRYPVGEGKAEEMFSEWVVK